MNYEDILPIAEKIKRRLAPYCDRIEIAGSIRRKKPVCNDIELCVIPKRVQTGLFSEDVAVDPGFCNLVNVMPGVKGEPTGKYTQRLIEVNHHQVKVDIFMTVAELWGSIFAIRTGSADFAHYVLAKGWTSQGYTSEQGVLLDKDGNAHTFKEEQELFDFLWLSMIPPEERDAAGEKAKVEYYAGRGL